MKIAKRRVLDEEIKIRSVKEKINDVYETRFTRLRTEHPEFSDLSDADLQAYIEVYDDHMGLGFLPHSMALMVGGCFMLFCSWLFFNAGSASTITQDKDVNIPQLTIVNTILSAVGSVSCVSLTGMFSDQVGSKQNITLKFDLTTLIGSIMSGCVSVTACCNNIEPHNSILIGFIGAVLYTTTVVMFQRLEIDDPLQVS